MAHIIRQTTVIRDGFHNAFTDLVQWQNCYWVGYRKGSAHVSPDSSACISLSSDRHRFREVAQVTVPGDVRDPKLVPLDSDTMAMVFPSWLNAANSERYGGKWHLQQYVAFTCDGFTWSQPMAILQPNRWLWRVRKWNGRYWGLVYGKTPDASQDLPVRTQHLMVSDDMREWENISQIGTGEHQFGEADILFREDGEAWIVSRSSVRPDYAWFASARPPYTEWDLKPLNTFIHCPAILSHKGVAYVAGRRQADLDGDSTYPFERFRSLGIWRLEHGSVSPVLRIPASGDCAYPGFIEDSKGRICMSYYSEHAYMMGVIDPPHTGKQGEHEDGQPSNPVAQPSAADVYFAEIALP